MPSPSPFERRPRATAFKIEDLLDKVRRGELRIPRFQRPFAWGAKDILDLLDSVYRGYPIGALLLWQRAALADRLELGPLQLDAPYTPQALWVVDGQQRVTTLAGVLLHPPFEASSAPDDFHLYFDLEEEEFVQPPRRGSPPPHWLPMNRVVDNEHLLNWLDRYPGRAAHPEHIQAAIRLGKVIREYEVPAYIVEADDEKLPRVIFARLNTTGRPLTEADVFNALHGDIHQEQPSDLPALASRLRDMEFGVLEDELLLKVYLASEGRDITGHDPQLHEEDLPGKLQKTERALRDTIIFLKRDAGILHIELLPYRLSLLLLVRLFALHPTPLARSRDLLARWVWRGAITGFHRGESIPEVHRSMAAIGQDEEASVQALLKQLPAGPRPAPDLGSYNFRTAETKLMVNALVALRPRHLRTGEILDIPKLIDAEGSKVLRPILTTESGPLHSMKQGLANRMFHPPLEGQSLAAALSPAVPAEVLASHGIPPTAIEALLQGDSERFLQARLNFLSSHITLFLNAHARWGESDRPSLQALIVSDEED